MKHRHILFLVLVLFLSNSCKKGEDDTAITSLPVLSIDYVTHLEGENNREVLVGVRLSRESESNVSVNYETVEGTAMVGTDFMAVSNGQLIFLPSETTKNISITILGDDIFEPDETFDILLSNPINATIVRGKSTITIRNDDEEEVVDTILDGIPTTGYTTPMSYPGRVLVWHDEFEGNSLSDDWKHEVGLESLIDNFSQRQYQYYKAENTRVKGSYLIIQTKKESIGGQQYTSSKITTQSKQSFKYGRIDIRAILPRGQAVKASLSMLGDSFSSIGWPDCGQIKIAKSLKDFVTEDATVRGELRLRNRFDRHHYRLNNGTFADEFHVFSIVWDSESIKWYVDDVFYHEADISSSASFEVRKPYFFVFNTRVESYDEFSPSEDTTPFPQKTVVDYVRVFQ